MMLPALYDVIIFHSCSFVQVVAKGLVYPWTWTEEEEQVFVASKKLLTSSNLLVHFDSKLELILACDASAYGILNRGSTGTRHA